MVQIFDGNLMCRSSVSDFLPRLEMSEENPKIMFYLEISQAVIAEITRIT